LADIKPERVKLPSDDEIEQGALQQIQNMGFPQNVNNHAEDARTAQADCTAKASFLTSNSRLNYNQPDWTDGGRMGERAAIQLSIPLKFLTYRY